MWTKQAPDFIFYTTADRFFPTSLKPHLQATLGVEMSDALALPPSDFIKQYSKSMQKALIDVGFWKCCLNCEHWSNKSPDRQSQPPSLICAKWNAAPPPEVIVMSCDQWMCVIPF